MLKKLSTCLNDFTHLFFPHVCEGCGSDVLPHDNVLCAICTLKLPETGFIAAKDNPVEKVFYGRIQTEAAGSAFYFTKNSMLQHLIVQLKYRNNKNMGLYLGNLVGQQLAETNRFDNVDLILPLPLNPKREQKRGYNQAALIAEGITQVWQRSIAKNALKRLVFTETQTHKDRTARWQTMEGVFAVTEPSVLENKHILLIDDIVTTGATLESCGEKILQVPGTRLSIATVAYTI